jgi:hypothetical protein
LFAFTLFLAAILFPITALDSSNSGPEITGESAHPVCSQVISNVNYQLSDTARVSRLNFDLAAPAKQVMMKLKSNSTEFTACTNVSGYHWRCTFPAGIATSSMDKFCLIAIGY